MTGDDWESIHIRCGHRPCKRKVVLIDVNLAKRTLLDQYLQAIGSCNFIFDSILFDGLKKYVLSNRYGMAWQADLVCYSCTTSFSISVLIVATMLTETFC